MEAGIEWERESNVRAEKVQVATISVTEAGRGGGQGRKRGVSGVWKAKEELTDGNFKDNVQGEGAPKTSQAGREQERSTGEQASSPGALSFIDKLVGHKVKRACNSIQPGKVQA